MCCPDFQNRDCGTDFFGLKLESEEWIPTKICVLGVNYAKIQFFFSKIKMEVVSLELTRTWIGGSHQLKNSLKRGSWEQHIPILHYNVSALLGHLWTRHTNKAHIVCVPGKASPQITKKYGATYFEQIPSLIYVWLPYHLAIITRDRSNFDKLILTAWFEINTKRTIFCIIFCWVVACMHKVSHACFYLGTTVHQCGLWFRPGREGTDLERGYGDLRPWRPPFRASPVVCKTPFLSLSRSLQDPLLSNP